jgi:hypothetical protein
VIIKSLDPWQVGYSYELVVPIGDNFDLEFKPELTPAEMLKLGIFGGQYFYDGEKEYPSEWFKDVQIIDKADPKLNFFEVNASQPLSVWEQKGWINPVDPRGWVQWYFRYYMGRRIPEEDARQIKRWKAIKRHVSQLQNNCQAGDWSCRRRQRQALLHWAYDSRKL